MGGPSAERKISLLTGKAICENLDKKKYNVSIIEMDKKCRIFLIKKNKRLLDLQGKDRKLFDVIFIALHGQPGEDGTVQGMLELFNIKYTGPGVLSSALAMDKVKAGEIYELFGLPTPPFVAFTARDWKADREGLLKKVVEIAGGYPVVIKPTNQGSAVGVSIVRDQEKFISAVNKTIKKFPSLMAQKFITGKEATCGVLEKNGQPFALPPTRIIPNLGEFYDYKSKYAAGGSTHVCPADFGVEVNKNLQELALAAHKALGCKGMSRTDIFVAEDKNLYVIETNTIPGMAPTSLLPEAAGKTNIPFSKMLDLIIEASL